MFIDGLIEFCKRKSENIKLKAEPQVFVEIANKLEELKAIKSDGFTDHLLNMGYSKGYNKAIDDFVERLWSKITTEIDDCADELDWIEEIARQMKVGEK